MRVAPRWSSLTVYERKALREAWVIGDFCQRAYPRAVPRLLELGLIELVNGHYRLSRSGRLYMRNSR